jgi:hypothetical protein
VKIGFILKAVKNNKFKQLTAYPKQEGLWNDDDLVYVMDTHR